MPLTFSILLYGRDPQLLDIRGQVLERAGHRVWETTDISQADRLADLKAVDLLIFCHTLSSEQCEHAVELACARWPQVRTLILTAGAAGCPDALSDNVLDAMDGPAKLISKVAQFGPPEARPSALQSVKNPAV